MGRKSVRDIRRKEILMAFAKVLAEHGFAGATMTAVGEMAGMSPGLLHHHFKNKDEMLSELLTFLISEFKSRNPHDVYEYIDFALNPSLRADSMLAKCWVGIFAEAVRNPALFERIKLHLESEISILGKISKDKLESKESSAILAYIFGSLVFGAFAPRRTSGFASVNGKLFAEKILST